jgi:DNA-directed RNA polymerase subunit alpha
MQVDERGKFAYTEGADQTYQIPLDTVGLSVRSYNCLMRAGISTLNQLIGFTMEDMLKIRNLGKNSYIEICDIAAQYGIIVSSDNCDTFLWTLF